MTDRAAFLNPDDMVALERLEETLSDDEGWDLPKATMRRLSELGVVRHHGGGYYSITSFGRWVLGNGLSVLPLETMDECNARLSREHKQRLEAMP